MITISTIVLLYASYWAYRILKENKGIPHKNWQPSNFWEFLGLTAIGLVLGAILLCVVVLILKYLP